MYCPRYATGCAAARRPYLICNCEAGSRMPLYIVPITELFVLKVQVRPGVGLGIAAVPGRRNSSRANGILDAETTGAKGYW